MTVSVYDTYVQRKDGNTMHFDILVPEQFDDIKAIHAYGKNYLATKSFKTGALTAKECQFCHIEEVPINIVQEINTHGYAIIELENCY